MPVYEFTCSSCGLSFEEMLNEPEDFYECPSCQDEAEIQVSDFGFKFESNEDDLPGQSGVYSLDSSVDRQIGRDSEKRWEYLKDRKSKKRELARKETEGGKDKVPLRKDPESGEYQRLPDEDVSKFQNLHGTYSEMLQEHRKMREERGIPRFEEDDSEESE